MTTEESIDALIAKLQTDGDKVVISWINPEGMEPWWCVEVGPPHKKKQEFRNGTLTGALQAALVISRIRAMVEAWPD